MNKSLAVSMVEKLLAKKVPVRLHIITGAFPDNHVTRGTIKDILVTPLLNEREKVQVRVYYLEDKEDFQRPIKAQWTTYVDRDDEASFDEDYTIRKINGVFTLTNAEPEEVEEIQQVTEEEEDHGEDTGELPMWASMVNKLRKAGKKVHLGFNALKQISGEELKAELEQLPAEKMPTIINELVVKHTPLKTVGSYISVHFHEPFHASIVSLMHISWREYDSIELKHISADDWLLDYAQ